MAQSPLEISLEKNIALQYSQPLTLLQNYNDLLKDDKHATPQAQAIIKVYKALCINALQQRTAAKELKNGISFSFDKSMNPLARNRYLYLQAIINYNEKEYKTAREQITKCINSVSSSENKTILCDAYYLAGSIEQKGGNPDSTLNYFSESLAISKKNKLYAQEAHSIRQLGYYDYFNKADFNGAKESYVKSLSISKEHRLSMVTAETYRSLGTIYQKQRKKDSTIYCIKKALTFYDSLEIDRGVISCYVGLGNAFYAVDNVKEAIRQLKRAEQIAITKSCKDFLPVIYNNWGAILPIEKVQERKKYFIKCIEKSKEFKNERIGAFGSLNLAEVYSKEKNFLAAQKELTAAKRALTSLSSKSNLLIANRMFVDFHLAWRKDKPSEYSKYAKPFDYESTLANGEQISLKNKDYNELENIYRSYINLYQGKNLAKVNQYQSQLIAIKDSTSSLNTTKAAYKYLEGVNTAEKEKAIIQLKADKEIAALEKKQLLLGGLLFLLSLGGLAYFIFQRNKRKNKEEQEKRAIKLRHRLANDLHDEVGSNLTGLVMLAEGISMSKNPPKESVDKLAILSRKAMITMRDTVWAIDSRKDSVEDLVYRMLDYTKGYFEDSYIEASVQHDVSDEEKVLNSELRQNIYLLFKEALNNVAKHSKGDTLKVNIEQKEEYFDLSIYNNGEVDQQMNKSGIGMQSMRERAETFGGTFSINTDNGFKVEARFNL